MVTRGALFVTGVTVLGLLAVLLRNNYSRFQKRLVLFSIGFFYDSFISTQMSLPQL